MKVLLCVTGSVAAIKVSQLATMLQEKGCEVKIVATENGKRFLENLEFITDEDEWKQWKSKGDPITHIELRKWADVCLIAPLSANSLAKIASGLCDNLVTCIVRAWDLQKPVIVAPAMNTHMWENPFTQKHLDVIQSVYRARVVPPKDDYVLACGDKGPGAMATLEDIVNAVVSN